MTDERSAPRRPGRPMPEPQPPPRRTPADVSAAPVRSLPAAGGEGRKPEHKPPTPPKPRLTPPPRSMSLDLDPAPARQMPAARPPLRHATPTSERRSPAGSLLTVALFGLLATAAAAVFLVLPDWVATPENSPSIEAAAAPPSPQALPPEALPPEALPAEALPAGPAPDWRNEAQKRLDARSALDHLGRRLEDLEARGIERWGQRDWRRARHLIAAAEASWQQRDFAAAEAAWRRADGHLAAEAERLPALLEAALAAGERALGGGETVAAKAAFERAESLAPGDPRPRAGLRRAAGWSRLKTAAAEAADAAGLGEWAAAEAAWAKVLALDPGDGEARRGLEQARRQLADGELAAILTEALAALDDGRWRAAREALARAAARRPGSPEVSAALARLEQAEKLSRIDDLQRQAAALEAAEQWREAAEVHGRLLALDEHLKIALEGYSRAVRRSALRESLDFHLENQSRLSEAAVLAEAEGLLETAAAIDRPGPEHVRRVEALEAAVAAFSRPVVAELRSDAVTDVTIYRVGHLGSFEQRRLHLRPGTYTVVGSRRGYRDVRLTWTLEPGVAPPVLDVRCQESL